MKFDLHKGLLFYRLLPFAILVLMAVSSCKPLRNPVYFKTLPNDTVVNRMVQNLGKTLIVSGDHLSIVVTSFNSELDLIFNTVEKTATTINPGTDYIPNGHVVDEDGTIKLHFIGKIKAEGLTLSQLKSNIEESLQLYMKDPIANVKFVNKKVTIIGSVATPKVIYLNEEEVPLLDILAQSGDLKDGGVANDIVVYRDSADTKLVKHINLEDHALFTSNWYYSKPNDIIFVKKDIGQAEREDKKRNIQLTMSLIVSFATLTVIILNSINK